MSTMIKATFRCMKQLWVHPNAKSVMKSLGTLESIPSGKGETTR